MFDTTVLIISRDLSLVREARRGISAENGLWLRHADGMDEAGCLIEGAGLGLVVVHLDESIDHETVASVLRRSSIRPRPVPVLVVSESYQPEEALAMFRMGVADYVSREDHIERLADLIGILALRTQVSPLRAVAPVACPENLPPLHLIRVAHE